MLVKGFTQDTSLYDITPIENMFIAEYMPRAKGDYVKVYLLALKLCYFPQEDYTTTDMSRELDIEEDEVKNALVYWAQCSLLEITSRRPFTIKMKNIKQMLQEETPNNGTMYKHQALIMQIQQSFGGRRLLNTSETKKVMNWADNLGWTPEMIALVTSWCIDNKNKWINFSYIDTVINNMAEQGIDGYEKAEEYITRVNAKTSGATQLLKDWNENRLATVDEHEVYDKWTKDWKFDAAMIREAQRNMVGISGNKFKYLDGLLKNWFDSGIDSLKKVKEYNNLVTDVKELLNIMGAKERISVELIQLYKKWLDLGFSKKSLLLAGGALRKEGNNSIEDISVVLHNWHEEDIISDEDIEKYLYSMSEAGKAFHDVHKIWGEVRASTKSEKRAYRQWIAQGYDHEKILEAARMAVTAEHKLPYMNAVLNKASSDNVQNNRKNDIHSRKYSSKEYDDVWDSLEDIT